MQKSQPQKLSFLKKYYLCHAHLPTEAAKAKVNRCSYPLYNGVHKRITLNQHPHLSTFTKKK